MKLLWVGDAAVPSGFARATHEILDVLRDDYEVTVLGMNYRGDPHPYPYKIYAAAVGGDALGIGRIIWMCDRVKPDVIVLQNDGWHIPYYLRLLREKKADGSYTFPTYAQIPVVAVVAVDGKNFRKGWLNGVNHAIFWTDFALQEARESGYTGPASVIPLGVSLTTFGPMPRKEARILRGLPPEYHDVFIVGNVNRNQPRKRWDLTLRYFANWMKEYRHDNAYLFLHCAPTGDDGIDVFQMAKYYNIDDRLMVVEPPTFYGPPDSVMRETYCSFDVQVTTTGGEGFGLTTYEGMACGIPQIVPDWSALGHLHNVAVTVPCTGTMLNPVAPALNIIHGVPDEKRHDGRGFVDVLEKLYQHPEWREQYGQAGRAHVSDDRFRWKNVGRRFADAIAEATAAKSDGAIREVVKVGV